MLYFLLFAVVALAQQSSSSGGNEQDNLQYGELVFTETTTKSLNATRMTIRFNIQCFQNLTSNNASQAATLALNQVLEVLNQFKEIIGQQSSVDTFTTTQLSIVEQNCDDHFTICPPGPSNNTTIQNVTLPPQNVTVPPQNVTVNGTTVTVPPQNVTVPPQNVTIPPMNVTGNGTAAQNVTIPPVPVPPINSTFNSSWGFLASMQLSFEANVSDGQQLILQLLKVGAPWAYLNGVSFAAANLDVDNARNSAVDTCLSGLRKQAEDMLNHLQVCFANWKRVWVKDLSDLTPISFNGNQFSSSNATQMAAEQTLKVQVTAIARFEDCNATNNSTGSS
jgi:hypothetical protein